MERDWAYLEAAALDLILDKLEERICHIRFGRVCKNWCSVAKLNHQNKQFRSHVLPMLLIPTESDSTIKRSLYGIPGNRLYPFRSPMLDNKRFCGSSHGWIATVDDANQYVITLINPFKNVAPIVLPWLSIGMSLDRVVLSVDPLTKPNDYVVAVIHSCRCRLALISAGQEFWTYVENTGVWYRDITFYRGLVYAVCGPIGWKYSIVSFKLPYSSMEKIIPNVFYQDSYLQRACLVKSLEGDLWMVTRFQVYKLELDAQNGKVLQMLKLESLGDNVLFISDFGDSTAASSFYFSNCLQKDLIYNATNDYDDDSLFDLWVYNVKEGRFIKHDPPINPSVKNESPTLWILPQFQWD